TELGIDDPLGTADLDSEILGTCSAAFLRRGLALGCLRDALRMLWNLAHDVLRRLVFAQAHEARVPENAVVRELTKRDLRDKFRLDPVRLLAVGTRHLDGDLVDLERPHALG